MASKKIVGLDIGSSHIRAIVAEIDKNGHLETIEEVFKQPIQTQIVTDGTVVSTSALSTNLKELINKNGIKEKEAWISINGSSVITRNMIGVEAEKDENVFRKTLPYKLRDQIPIKWEENEYSYHVTKEYLDEEKNILLRDIIFVAISKENIKNILNAVREVGLDPYIIDIASLSILRATMSSSEIRDQRVASIDIGGDTTNIIIHKNGLPEYIRNITGLGGNVINQRISSDLKIPSHEAELEKFKALSRENTIAEKTQSVFGGFEIDGIDPNSREAAIAQTINRIVAQEASILVSQVRDTFADAVFNSITIDSEIEHIFLSGGGSGIQTFSARLENELSQIPVSYLNPLEKYASKGLKKLIADGKVLPHEYATVFGLVYRTEEESKK